jgi:Uma2 family endonuclease
VIDYDEFRAEPTATLLAFRRARLELLMSTIPERRTKADAVPPRARKAQKPRAGKASFRYGYRDVRKKLPDGRYQWVRVPLTLDDVLHPRFGDVHVLGDPHGDDCNYLKYVLKARHAGDRSVAVFSDCGIFWDIPGLRHHSPDLSVIFGVKRRKDWNTFDVKIEKVRPVLIIEVTSRDTRVNDVKTKVEEYARAKVPHYVIADVGESDGPRRLSLKRYRLKGDAYEQVPLDEHGRAWLEPVGLWLGVRVNPDTGGERVVLIDRATNAEIGDYTAVDQARAQAEERAAAEAKARAAEAKARAVEAKARSRAEAKARKLEAELRRLKGRS